MRETVDIDLQEWGECFGRSLEASGYPGTTLMRKIGTGGISRHERYGTNVLVDDMPPRVRAVHAEVERLGTEYFAALVARYCVPCRDRNGRRYSQADVARLLGCTPAAFKKRLQRARTTLRERGLCA